MSTRTFAPGVPADGSSGPFDAAVLAQLANAFFRAVPGGAPAGVPSHAASPQAVAPAAPHAAPPSAGVPAGAPPLSGPQSGAAETASLDALASAALPPPGVQSPGNVAPAGSPLASPAGFGPGVPGTPIPQGLAPGVNLIPASPSSLPSLAYRAPVYVPNASAGNGVPDVLVKTVPAYEPRIGGQLLGVPQAASSGGRPAGAVPWPGANQALHSAPGQAMGLGAGAGPASPAETASLHSRAAEAPQFYFLPDAPDPGSVAGTAPAALPAPSPDAARRLPHADATPSAPRQPSPSPVFADVPQLVQAGRGGYPAFDVHAVRRDFPILGERVHGRQLVWFDNAATTHKPQAVIDRLAYFYAHENSNIHRAAHELAARATDAYEHARETVRRFIHAPDADEVIFVRGTTEAINLVAKSWGDRHVGEGDEIIVSHLEHHANIVPWQQLAKRKGARLRVIPVDDNGQVLLDEYSKLLNARTKIVSVTQVSNALGTVVPVREIVELAHRAGARALVDGAQSVSHLAVDVQAIGADIFVFSGHKIFGPTGIGVLWGRRDVLDDMPEWQGGGNMIADVTFEKTVFQPIPNKFEAGTGNIADAVGLGAALDYVSRLGLENIARYEHDLLVYGMQRLGEIPGLRLIGTAPDKASVMSFVLDGYSTDEVGQALNQEGIAVRTGHHCAQPILRRFGVETTVRPSLAFYNTFEEIDRLAATVRALSSRRPTA